MLRFCYHLVRLSSFFQATVPVHGGPSPIRVVAITQNVSMAVQLLRRALGIMPTCLFPIRGGVWRGTPIPICMALRPIDPMHLVMFDIDGTLTQSCGVDSRCFVDALCEVLGIERIDTDWSNYRHTTDSGIAHEIITEQLGRPARAEELAAVKTSFVRRLRWALDNDPAECQANAGAQDILKWINHQRDFCFAVATGGWSESARMKLANAGLKVPENIFASSDDAVSREGILRIAEARARSAYSVDRFDSITYIGDAVWDLRAAEACKYSFIGVAVGDAARQLREAGAASLVTSFAEGSGFRDLVERKLLV